MRKIDCDICGQKEVPLKDTIKIDGKVYCSNCLETHFPDQRELKKMNVEKEIDPTICSFCGKDFGKVELNKISVYPICTECETTVKNKTFPAWVKVFFIGILIIVVLSFIWNWRFYSAYTDFQDSGAYFEKGNFEKAALLIQSASKKVPEVEDLKTISAYYKGFELLTKDKSSEALIEFEKCKDKVPPEFDLNTLIIQAKIGSTFDNKDYNGFLEAAKENLALDTTLAISLTSVASAYACIYADKGNEDDKQNALFYLNKAKQIDSTGQEMTTYYNMVEYRIYSRKIIKREDFIKQFPNGWTK